MRTITKTLGFLLTLHIFNIITISLGALVLTFVLNGALIVFTDIISEAYDKTIEKEIKKQNFNRNK